MAQEQAWGYASTKPLPGQMGAAFGFRYAGMQVDTIGAWKAPQSKASDHAFFNDDPGVGWSRGVPRPAGAPPGGVAHFITGVPEMMWACRFDGAMVYFSLGNTDQEV